MSSTLWAPISSSCLKSSWWERRWERRATSAQARARGAGLVGAAAAQGSELRALLGVPRLYRAYLSWAALHRVWESGPGREARGGVGAAGLAGPWGGMGEGRGGWRNWSPRGPGAVFLAGRCFQGHLGDAWGTRGHWLVGRLAPTWLVSGRLGVLCPSLPCSGASDSIWNRALGADKAAVCSTWVFFCSVIYSSKLWNAKAVKKTKYPQTTWTWVIGRTIPFFCVGCGFCLPSKLNIKVLWSFHFGSLIDNIIIYLYAEMLKKQC